MGSRREVGALYSVVLVDDECIIIEGLKRVVDWGRYGCEVVATATDAESGAHIIRERSPDILFTDIKMPNMDGLTMLAGLKGEFPAMQIAVLTGFRDFEYAQRALNLGVTRFLLKPSKMRELEEALSVMTENLRRHGGARQSGEAQETLPENNTDSANSFIVRNALKYIDSHYTEKLTLTELADKTYVSSWYLSKLLNKYTGKSFNDLFNLARIRKAEKLLEDPSLKIHQIADLLAFSDVTHFSKTFKKYMEVSPNEFRNRFV